jgi:hypothetical protein
MKRIPAGAECTYDSQTKTIAHVDCNPEPVATRNDDGLARELGFIAHDDAIQRTDWALSHLPESDRSNTGRPEPFSHRGQESFVFTQEAK